MRRALGLTVAVVSVASCEPSVDPPRSPPSAAHSEEPPFELPRPNVIVDANPPPPFTYWAPDGSTIRNHGNPDVWIAYIANRQIIYFGDSCGRPGGSVMWANL
jgi:hypothetical protein